MDYTHSLKRLLTSYCPARARVGLAGWSIPPPSPGAREQWRLVGMAPHGGLVKFPRQGEIVGVTTAPALLCSRTGQRDYLLQTMVWGEGRVV